MNIYLKYPQGYYVYAYIRSSDSNTGTVGTPYYIGKGVKHRAYSWHSKLIAKPKDPRFIVIIAENLTELGAFALERRLIKWYGRVDLGTGILHNRTDGGEGGSGNKPSQLTLHKRSVAMRGKKKSTQHKEKLSAALKGRVVTEETRKKISEGRKNSGIPRPKHSEETKEKMRQKHLGKTLSAETKEKLKQLNLGKTISEATKMKISNTMKQIKRGNKDIPSYK
jgi:hypothetical protein